MKLYNLGYNFMDQTFRKIINIKMLKRKSFIHPNKASLCLILIFCRCRDIKSRWDQKF